MRSRDRWFSRKSIALFLAVLVAGACSTGENIETLHPGVLTVAVTNDQPTSEHDPQGWINRYVELFAAEHDLAVDWVVVPFNESWLLAGSDEVDLVATNVASFAYRESEGATFSEAFLYERRALRINPDDRDEYAHIDDFVGSTIGVVEGMASARDVNRRAPDGVNVATFNSFAELYAAFDAREVDAIAEAEYYALDGSVIPSHGGEVVLIDHHDLNPGEREESVFVVRDKSTNLLSAINAFLADSPFPP